MKEIYTAPTEGAVSDASEKWGLPIRDWTVILNQLRVYFGERVDAYLICMED